MTDRIFVTLFIVACFTLNGWSQMLSIRFIPSFGGKEIALDRYYHLPNGDSISFSAFRCYISAIELYGKGRLIYKEKESYHLLDVEQENMTIVLADIPKYDAIQFNIGLDSAISVSGALGGDLDPTKGMYWAWQSGYINFKLEGNSNICKTRNNEFIFHIGGYANKDKAVQTVRFSLEASNDLRIEIPIDKFLNSINLAKQNEIMIPGAEAVGLAKQFAHLFQIMHR